MSRIICNITQLMFFLFESALLQSNWNKRQCIFIYRLIQIIKRFWQARCLYLHKTYHFQNFQTKI